MSTNPAGHPLIPTEANADSIVAIVTIHDPKAVGANQNTEFQKTFFRTQNVQRTTRGTVEGCHIFLHQLDNQACYTFGRTEPNRSSKLGHVFLPVTQVGTSHLRLVPVWSTNAWRVESTSGIISIVNDVPIRRVSSRGKKPQKPLPRAVYLRQDVMNRITIDDLRVDIWLLQSVRAIYPTPSFEPQALNAELQNVKHRPDLWAQNRYILSRDQVSGTSHRVYERFTGETQTAKLFRSVQHGQQRRDDEFSIFNMKEVDASIVRYLQSTHIDDVPAVITDTHQGFTSYAACRGEIRSQHPSSRFSIAAKLLLRLFSALTFLQFHGITHGNVTHESVLLQLGNNGAVSVLLVNYSNATSHVSGMQIPLEDMIEDGRAAMSIVEDCSDIWQLRKAASEDAMSEAFMAKKTVAAQKEYELMQRVLSDFLQVKGGSRSSEKGKKLIRLLELKQINWQRCQDDQLHNATRREIGMCYNANIEKMVQDWRRVHPISRIGEEKFMLLSLGHPWFDHLAGQLYHKRWDLLPQDICAKFKALAGNVEEPWQSLEVTRVVTFTQTAYGLDTGPFVEWLASCCEVFPEWRGELKTQLKSQIAPHGTFVERAALRSLQEALERQGTLPPFMVTTFAVLLADDIDRQPSFDVAETCSVWSHIPSRMFNLTQFHRLSSPHQFLRCVDEGSIRCDNFVEVRGEPKLQGCYAPLSLLQDFAQQLGLVVPQIPHYSSTFPTYDPADFSRVHSGRIVLARTGLVAFASIPRSGNQCDFHAPRLPKESETRNTFLPTYFGDMNVLPQLPVGVDEYARPDHWSKFKTAEELDAAANMGARNIIQPKGQRHKLVPKTKPVPLTPAYDESMPIDDSVSMEVDESRLSDALKQRERVREQARPPIKRNTDAQASEASNPSAKRLRPSSPNSATASTERNLLNVTVSFANRAAQRLENMAQGTPTDPGTQTPMIPNMSFFQRENGVNVNLLTSAPTAPMDPNRSFTVASGSFDIEDDWRQTEEWLKYLKEDEDKPQLEGLFGFRFHHSHLEEESDTEKDSSDASSPGDKDKDKPGKGDDHVQKKSGPPLLPRVGPLPPSSTWPKQGISASSSFVAQPPPQSQPQEPVATVDPHPPLAAPLDMLSIPNGAVHNWFLGQENAQDNDSDMPDTDGESTGST